MNTLRYWWISAKYAVLAFLRRLFGTGCDCGEKEFVEGKCVDCWPGYDSCARPGCGHYRCEHQFPGSNTFVVSYSKDNTEQVGESFEWPVDCMVNDGEEHCAAFVEGGSR